MKVTLSMSCPRSVPLCCQPWMSVIYEGGIVSVLSQECSSMCRQPWMSFIYEGDIVSVLSQECSSMCCQPRMSVIYEGDIVSLVSQEVPLCAVSKGDWMFTADLPNDWSRLPLDAACTQILA